MLLKCCGKAHSPDSELLGHACCDGSLGLQSHRCDYFIVLLFLSAYPSSHVPDYCILWIYGFHVCLRKAKVCNILLGNISAGVARKTLALFWPHLTACLISWCLLPFLHVKYLSLFYFPACSTIQSLCVELCPGPTQGQPSSDNSQQAGTCWF